MANTWEAYLCDRFGFPISNISRVCFGKQLTQTLNQPAQFTFWAPSNAAQVATLHTDGKPYLMEGRAIRVYRSGVLVFTGHLWQVEDDGDAESVKTAVTCFDPLQWLARRVCRQMIFGIATSGTPSIDQFFSFPGAAGGTDQIYSFTLAGILQSTYNGTDIVRGILNATNDYDGFTGLDDYYLSAFYRPNNASPGSCTNDPGVGTSQQVAPVFANSKASDIIATLVGQNDSFDLEVVPTDVDYYSSPDALTVPPAATYHQAYLYGSAGDYSAIRGTLLTKPWKTLALLKYWVSTRGSTQQSVVFGYDTYPHNVAQVSYLVDLTELTNNSRMMANKLTEGSVNTASVQTYGVGMDVQSLSDITDGVLLAALATEEATLGGNAKRTLSITPVGGSRTPLPFDDFNVGDQIAVNVGPAMRGGFTGTQRVYGFTLDINDDHTTETLSNLVTSPQTA